MPTLPTTSSFIMTFDDILTAAFARLGGETMSGFNARSSKRAVAVMMNEWANFGVPLGWVAPFSGEVTYDQEIFVLPSDAVDVSEVISKDYQGSNITLNRIGRGTWNDISMKQSKGRPSQFWVNRDRATVSIYMNPRPDRNYTIEGFYTRRPRDVLELTDYVDIPPRYYETMVSGVAYFLGRENIDIEEGKLARLKSDYDMARSAASDADQDSAPWQVMPNLTMYSGY